MRVWPRRKYRSAEILSGEAPETRGSRPEPARGRPIHEPSRRYRPLPRLTSRLILALDAELSARLRSAARARDQAAGEFITELLARGLDQEAQRARAQALLEALTPRERQVVGMTGRGQTNRQIGEALVISPETVKTHIRHALGKLGLRSKAELRMLLLELGIRWWEGNAETG